MPPPSTWTNFRAIRESITMESLLERYNVRLRRVGCLTVHQAGFRNVVALMGSTLTEPQEKILRSRFDEVVLMLDGDRPGREARERIAAQLAGKIPVRVILLPEGKQPDQMNSAEIRNILATRPTRQPLSEGRQAQQITAASKIRSRDSR